MFVRRRFTTIIYTDVLGQFPLYDNLVAGLCVFFYEMIAFKPRRVITCSTIRTHVNIVTCCVRKCSTTCIWLHAH